MRRGIYCLLLVISIVAFSSCEEDPEELQLNDFVNQEYEAKKNRLFAATIGFEEFEAKNVKVDSFNGQWVFWAFNEKKQIKLILPYLKEQVYFANDSNIEMRYKELGGEWYSSHMATKKSHYLKIEIKRIDTFKNQLYGNFEGLVSSEKREELLVESGIFNRVKF